MKYPNNSIAEDPVKADFSNFSDLRVNVAAYLTAESPAFGAMDNMDFDFLAGTSISAPLITRSLAGFLGPNGRTRLEWEAEKLEQSASLLGANQVQGGFYLPVCSDF